MQCLSPSFRLDIAHSANAAETGYAESCDARLVGKPVTVYSARIRFEVISVFGNGYRSESLGNGGKCNVAEYAKRLNKSKYHEESIQYVSPLLKI
jgi:hypothetical protein